MYEIKNISKVSSLKIIWFFIEPIFSTFFISPIFFLDSNINKLYSLLILNKGILAVYILTWIFVLSFYILVVLQIIYKTRAEIYFQKNNEIILSNKKIRKLLKKRKNASISTKLINFINMNSMVAMLIFKKRNYFLFSFFQCLCFISFITCFLALFNSSISENIKFIFYELEFPLFPILLSLFITIGIYYVCHEYLKYEGLNSNKNYFLNILNSDISEILINKFYSFINDKTLPNVNILKTSINLDIEKDETLPTRTWFIIFTKYSFVIYSFMCGAFLSAFFTSFFIDIGSFHLLPFANFTIISFSLAYLTNVIGVYKNPFKKQEHKLFQKISIIDLRVSFENFSNFYSFYIIYFLLVSNREIIYKMNLDDYKNVYFIINNKTYSFNIKRIFSGIVIMQNYALINLKTY